MHRLVGSMAVVFLVGMLSLSNVLGPITPPLAAQEDPHGAPHDEMSGNAIEARADTGVISMESGRFTCTLCLARVATAIEAIPGVAEVGTIPAAFPPVVIVRFAPDQATAETIVDTAKAALESDPFNPARVAVTLEFAPVQTPSTLAAIDRFTTASLWVRPLDATNLRMDSELFDCGSCIGYSSHALQETPGVTGTSVESSGGSLALRVAYDPQTISADEVVGVVKSSLEAAQLDQTTVSVYMLPQ